MDPIEFEATRLILRNRRVGGVDAVALVEALQASPVFDSSDRADLLDAIEESLDTPGEKYRFAAALSTAGVTDAYLGRDGNGRAEIPPLTGTPPQRLGAMVRSWHLTGWDRLCSIAADIGAAPKERDAAKAALLALGSDQLELLASEDSLSDAADEIDEFGDLAQIACHLETDLDWFNVIVGMARMYAYEDAEGRGGYNSSEQAIVDALDGMKDALIESQARGAGREFLGGFAGVLGAEFVVRLVPAGSRLKYGKGIKAVAVLFDRKGMADRSSR